MSNYRKYIDFIDDAKKTLINISEIMEKKDDFGIRKIVISEIRKILKGKITYRQLMCDKDELGVLSEQAKRTHQERYDRKPRGVCKRCHCKIAPYQELYVDKQGGVYCSMSCIMKEAAFERICPNDGKYNKFVKQSIVNNQRG